MVDLSIYAGNNRKALSSATVGSIGVTLPGNMGTIATATSYKIGTIPAGSLVTAVSLVVETAFDYGTTNTVDIGTTDGGAELGNDLSLAAAAVVDGLGGIYVAVATDIYFTPTIDGTAGTVGDAKVVVEFVETDSYMATFTA
jgi:hypothetical protein